MRHLLNPLLALLLCPAAWAGEVVPGASAPGEVSFSVRFDEPEWRSEVHQGASYRFPVWPDLATATEPGRPQVPYRLVRVAVPPEGAVTVNFTAAEGGRTGNARFVPAPGPERGHGDSFPRPSVDTLPSGPREEGPGYDREGPRVELLEVAEVRGLRVAKVRVSPVRWDPVSGELDWAREVSVTVRFVPQPRGSGFRGSRDLAFDRAWPEQVVNSQDVSRFRGSSRSGGAGAPPAAAETVPQHYFDDAEQWVRVRLSQNGVYRITGADLQNLGIALATLDPQRLRMFSGPLLEDFRFDAEDDLLWLHVYEATGFTSGFEEPVQATDGRPGMKEVALALSLGGDDVLDAGDELVFYGLGPDNFLDRFGEASTEFYENTYTGETVYWLGINTDYPWEPLRIQDTAAAPAGEDLRTSQRVRLHFEDNRVYDPTLHTDGIRWERYFWWRMTTSTGAVEDLVLPDAVPGSTMDFRVRLWGANQPIGSGVELNHNARIDVNGTTATVSWRVNPYKSRVPGYDHFDTTLTGVSALEATRLEIEVVDYPVPTRRDVVHLAWVEAFYLRELNARQSPLEFDFDGAGDGIEVTGLPSGEAWALDVTDFRRPRRLVGVVGDERVAVDPGDEPGVMHVTGSSAFLAPVLELKPTPQRWLRDASQPVDYFIITHPSFRAEADSLAAYRRQHVPGITETRAARVQVVDVTEVYDEFSGGMPDPVALRHFLEYAYLYYGGELDDPPAYCLFLGDASYDPRNFEGFGEQNLIPTWMYKFGSDSFLTFGSLQYVTDDYLLRFDGPFDQAADLAGGRLPVSTSAQARLLVFDKILGSERSPDRGPWRTKAVLIADDVCQGLELDSGLLGAHMYQSEQVDDVIPAAFDRKKVYLYEYGEECIYATKPDAKRDLLEAWNRGAWLVNYIGHGASIVLSDERVLDLEDVPGLVNAGRLSLFCAFSCSVGKFSNPSLTGIGEAVLVQSAGAASASVVATYLTPSLGNSRLNREFILALFPGEPAEPLTVGAALFFSKQAGLVGGSLAEKYVLLGDPAARPNVPEAMLQLEGVESVQRGAQEALAVHSGPGPQGLVDVIVQDARERKDRDKDGDPIPNLFNGYLRDASTLFRGQSRLDADGETTVNYVTPVTLREGDDGRVRAYAWGDNWDAVAALSPLDAGGQSVSPEDSLGPNIEVQLEDGIFFPGEEVTLTLEDPAGIDISRLFEFRGILVRFRDLDGTELARLNITDSFGYDLGSYTSGAAAFQVPDIAAGSYNLVVSSFDNFANRGEVTLTVTVGDPAAPPQLSDVYAYPNPLESETDLVFTLDRAGEVEVTIYSVRGRKVREDSRPATPGRNAWRWDGRDAVGDAVANGVYLLQLVLKGQDGGFVTRHLERLVVYR